jgi:peptide-methionine (S)-S-oxide reductase
VFFGKKKLEMPSREDALPGRDSPIIQPGRHFVNDQSLAPPYPAGTGRALFGLGCFWGAERIFWQLPGVHVTAVGYAGGLTPNPTYEEVCSGRTGHTEVVLVVFRPSLVSFEALLRRFWESHDPTQGMRQGNDIGTQYRSAVFTYSDEQLAIAEASRETYQEALGAFFNGTATTEIREAPAFYFAEDYHQQYLAKNPQGYCGIGGTGVSCPIGLGATADS